ncbi:MAG: CoA transferase [Sphingobium sp.]
MLDDLRIVEVGEGMAVQVAGLMFSELGADVVKVERPTGDPARGQASFANWNRGKRSLVADIDAQEGRTALRERIATADVLLHQFTPSRARALGLDDESLARDFPRLVVCGITGSPVDHPDAERSDDELLVSARLGVLYENDGYRPGPIAWRYRMGGWSAAHLAVAGILARMIMRLASGRGGAAHTTIMQGYMSAMPMVWTRNSEGPMPNTPTYDPAVARAGRTRQQLWECANGEWLQIMDPTQQFDYASMPTMWDVMAEGVEIDTEEGTAKAFRMRPRDSWIADLRAADIAAEPVLPMGGMLFHEDVLANGYAVAVDDPEIGQTVQPNTPFHSDARLRQGLPAPSLGQGGEAEWKSPPAAIGCDHAPAAPLAGVRVIDCGMFLAGPMGPSLMGDMGADVIKVESLTGDRIRFMHRYYQAASRSKRSLAVDLTQPQGREILNRLIGWGEVLHHNMRFKGADKLGLSEDAVRAANPDIVFSYVSAYGQRGARGNWPGYDSIFNALAGWMFENAGEGNRPVFNRPGTVDIVTAQSCLVGIMASLYRQRAGGPAYSTQTSLLGISAFMQGEILIGPDGKLTRTYHLDSDQYGFSPYHRIYRAADGWIAVAAKKPDQQAALRAVLGANVEADFVAACEGRKADALIAVFDAAGVPADIVLFEDAANRFFDDPVNRELGLVSALPHPRYGIVEQPGDFWNFGDTPMAVTRACPDLGEHSDEILRELGYSNAEIAQFKDEKIVA